MKKIILLYLLTTGFFFETNSQITFERKFYKTHGFIDGYSVWSTLQLGDGGYVFTGRVDSSLFIGRLNPGGKIIWLKKFGGDYTNTGRYMIRTSDNCFVVSGDYGTNYTWSFYIIKFDSTGSVKFEKHYRGANDVKGVSVAEATDGNYLVIGNSNDGTIYYSHILKINKTTGDSMWCKTYKDPDYIKFYEIKKVKDNNFVMVGTRYDSICLMKINNNGDSLWSKRYIRYYTGFTFTQAADNGYIVGADGLICRIKADGSLYWVKYQDELGFGSSYWVNFNSVIPTYDGNFAVAGSWDPDYPWAFLYKISPAGDSIFRRLFYTKDTWQEALFVEQTKDSGFVISGDQWDTAHYWTFSYLDVIKTDKNGEIYKIDTPKICLVTLDPASEKNRIIWERQNSKGIEKYIVSRKEGLNWSPLTTKPYDSLSVYIDKTSSPEKYHYQYSIMAVNYNGDTVPRSPYVETILLQASPGTSGNVANLHWNPYLDESGKFIPEYYFIYKGKSKTSCVKIDSISGDTKNPSYNDTHYDGTMTYYQVGFRKNKDCTPAVLKSEAGPYSQSLSNIVEYKATKRNEFYEIPVTVYPNPFTDILNIDYSLDKNGNVLIEVYNNLGELLYATEYAQATTGTNTCNLYLSTLASGMYSIKIISGEKISLIKVSKQ